MFLIARCLARIQAVVHVAVEDVPDREAQHIVLKGQSGFANDTPGLRFVEAVEDDLQFVEHHLMLRLVRCEFGIADLGQQLLLVAEMRLQHLVELLGERLQFIEVAMILPDVCDFQREIEDRLVLRVDLRLMNLEVVAPGDQLLEGNPERL